jgi:uncharacterized protein YcbX
MGLIAAPRYLCQRAPAGADSGVGLVRTMRVGEVAGLWRYPVKSLGGESLDGADIGPRGILGDRLWAVRDVEGDITASARRVPALLTATARYCDPVPSTAGPGNVPKVEIRFPDGTVLHSDDANVDAKLSNLAGRRMRLTALPLLEDTSLHLLKREQRVRAMSASIARADLGVADEEKFPDASMVPIADLLTLARYATPPGMFADLAPLHLITETSVATIAAELGGSLDVRRFRPNVVIRLTAADGDLPEAEWPGSSLWVGDARVTVRMQTLRCVVPSRAHVGLGVDRRITSAVAGRALRCLGVYAGVSGTGAVRVGDAVEVSAQHSGRLHQLLSSATTRSKRLAFGLVTSAADRMSR